MGVPDFYQSTELWDLSLVDPDNRRPVDYILRERLLKASSGIGAEEVLLDWDAGLPKLWMMAQVLKLRMDRPQMFSAESRYRPMSATGERISNLFSCRRGESLIAVVPRFGMSVKDEWEDTQLPLPAGEWRSLFTGQMLATKATPTELFEKFPVALLLRS